MTAKVVLQNNVLRENVQYTYRCDRVEHQCVKWLLDMLDEHQNRTEHNFIRTPIGIKPVRIQSTYEPLHWISNNVVCATSKASDQPAHTRSLIRAFASRLNSL